VDVSVPLLEQAVKHDRSLVQHTIQSLDRARLTNAYLLASRREDARAHALVTFTLARRYPVLSPGLHLQRAAVRLPARDLPLPA
jgi:hypothetical protein